MSSIPAGVSPHLTLDELSQLCEEIAALTRAGVPLETALGQRAVDLPRRLSRAANHLSLRLSAGESLEAALREERQSFPPVFTALVAAGARTGRLSESLQNLTATARSLADLRQCVLGALVYPLTVALVAYGMFAFLATAMIPSFWRIFQDFQVIPPAWMEPVIWLGRQDGLWWLAPPLIVALLGLWWWYRSAQGEILAGRGGWTLLWMPPARRMLRDARWATFCDVLALMVKYGVPLHEALRLAGAASLEPRLTAASQQLAAELERGGRISEEDDMLRNVPPQVRMALAAQQSQFQLAARLGEAAENYRQAAIRRSFWLRTLLPGLFTLAIAATSVTVVVAMIAWPWLRIVLFLGQEAMR